MRIEGPAQLRNTTGPKRAGRAGAGGGVFRLHDDAEATRATGSAAPAQPVSDVNALLALQELPDATEGRSAGLKRGGELLDMLDQMRHALLVGRMPEAQLKRLLTMVRARADAPMEAGLRDVLGDIELRAAVELAKFQQTG
ncbi:MAG: flagellar assembly protein FliX [Alphaproteobacteria bacterium]